MSLGILSFAEPAAAQGSLPVTVVNGEGDAVPVFPAGRRHYQMTFAVSKSLLGEDCDLIPVPEGTLLKITSVGVDATIDDADTPDVSVRLTRSIPSGASSHRFRGALHFVSSGSFTRNYKGIYNLDLLVGQATGEASYSAAICVRGSPSGAGAANSARGTVTGYIEPTAIVDGNTLP